MSKSWRKLFGLDAPEQLNIALERRVEEESADIAEVLFKVIPEVLEAVDVDDTFRSRLTSYALELAGWHLRAADGEDPGRPAPPGAPAATRPAARSVGRRGARTLPARAGQRG
ncbi:hypothetical protein [Streptomyces sp. NPDC096013]|uniref:hypothetical protein n=1 Tax=Streptomyces sp. NPDC096013 TaxID=3366069 RepID=UPI0038219C9D